MRNMYALYITQVLWLIVCVKGINASQKIVKIIKSGCVRFDEHGLVETSHDGC